MTDAEIRAALWKLFKLPFLDLSSQEDDIIDGILFSREGKDIWPNCKSLSRQRRELALEILRKYTHSLSAEEPKR